MPVERQTAPPAPPPEDLRALDTPEPGDVADPVLAVARYLKDEMGARVAGQVWQPELPQWIDRSMPTNAIVLMPGGGGKLMAGNRLPVIDSFVDILCYGASRQEASDIARQAASLLRQFAMVKSEGVLMYWARLASGINPRVELGVNWNFSEFTIQVLHSEVVVG